MSLKQKQNVDTTDQKRTMQLDFIGKQLGNDDRDFDALEKMNKTLMRDLNRRDIFKKECEQQEKLQKERQIIKVDSVSCDESNDEMQQTAKTQFSQFSLSSSLMKSQKYKMSSNQDSAKSQPIAISRTMNNSELTSNTLNLKSTTL